MADASPTNIRDVIGEQRNVQHGVGALLRGLCAKIYAAADSGDFGPLVALADDIAANPEHWADAIVKNTPHAGATGALEMDMTRVPTGMASAFPFPGVRSTYAQGRADAEAEAAKAKRPDAEAKRAERDQAAASAQTGAVAARPQADSDRGRAERP